MPGGSGSNPRGSQRRQFDGDVDALVGDETAGRCSRRGRIAS